MGKMHKLRRAISTCILLSSGAAAAQAVPPSSLLVDRLDLSHLQLPSGQLTISQSHADLVGLAQTLGALDGVLDTPQIVTENGVARVEIGSKIIERKEHLDVVTVDDERGYSATLVATRPSDTELVDIVRRIAPQLGVSIHELDVRVRGLGAIEQTRDLRTSAPVRVATKVFCQRVINGLPVKGDFMVVSFANDGSLRKIVSRWRQLPAFVRSPKGGLDSIPIAAVEAANAAIARHGLLVSPAQSVRVYTFIRPSPSNPTQSEIAGTAQLPLVTPDGKVRFSDVEFSIP